MYIHLSEHFTNRHILMLFAMLDKWSWLSHFVSSFNDAGVFFFCFFKKTTTINQPPKPKNCSLITIKQICFVLQIVKKIRIQIIIDNCYLTVRNNIELFKNIVAFSNVLASWWPSIYWKAKKSCAFSTSWSID